MTVQISDVESEIPVGSLAILSGMFCLKLECATEQFYWNPRNISTGLSDACGTIPATNQQLNQRKSR